MTGPDRERALAELCEAQGDAIVRLRDRAREFEDWIDRNGGTIRAILGSIDLILPRLDALEQKGVAQATVSDDIYVRVSARIDALEAGVALHDRCVVETINTFRAQHDLIDDVYRRLDVIEGGAERVGDLATKATQTFEAMGAAIGEVYQRFEVIEKAAADAMLEQKKPAPREFPIANPPIRGFLCVSCDAGPGDEHKDDCPIQISHDAGFKLGIAEGRKRAAARLRELAFAQDQESEADDDEPAQTAWGYREAAKAIDGNQ